MFEMGWAQQLWFIGSLIVYYTKIISGIFALQFLPFCTCRFKLTRCWSGADDNTLYFSAIQKSTYGLRGGLTPYILSFFIGIPPWTMHFQSSQTFHHGNDMTPSVSGHVKKLFSLLIHLLTDDYHFPNKLVQGLIWFLASAPSLGMIHLFVPYGDCQIQLLILVQAVRQRNHRMNT